MSQAGSILRNSGPGGFVQTLNLVSPIAGNINLTSTGGTIDITPNIGFGTVNLEVDGTVATSFNGNTGTAIPVAGVLNVITANSTPIFAGAGNTLTLDFNLTSNLGLGSSLTALTTGTGNLTYGRFAGQSLTSGLSNVLIGVAAGAALTTGSTNVFIGQSVAASSTATAGNVGIGIGALLALSSGLSHTAVGASSLTQVTTGSYSTCLGSNSGANYTGANSSNICIGYNTTGTVGESNVLRIGNATGAGNGALSSAFICGIDGVNVGSTAKVVTMGTGGTADKLGTATITGSSTIVVTPGANTITLSTSGSAVGSTITGNTGGAISPTAGNWNFLTANTNVVFAGSGSTETLDFALTTNLLLGSNGAITTSLGNTGLGVGALAGISTQGNNTAVGRAALNLTTNGLANCAYGINSLTNLTSGQNNSAFGTTSGTSLLTGANNTMLGVSAGSLYVGAESNNICINSSGIAAESNVCRIGAATGVGTQQLSKTFICGIDGVNVGSVAKVLTMASDQLGTATITAGAGITVTPSANTITIAAAGAGFTWALTTVDASIVVENGYIANKAGLLTMTLPATAAIGDVFIITNINTAVGFRIAQNALQQIRIGTSTTTIGVTGYLEATALGDTVECVCTTAGTSTRWQVIDVIGNITVV